MERIIQPTYVERLSGENINRSEITGQKPEGEPFHEFTVLVEETYLVPYRVRARSQDEAVRRVLDDVEGEEEWAHVEWVEGSDRLLSAVWPNPLSTKSPLLAAADTAPAAGGAADPDRAVTTPCGVLPPPGPRMLDYHRACPLPEHERVLYRLTTADVDAMLEMLGIGVEAMSDEEREEAYLRVQRLIEKSEMWGEQCSYTVDAATEELPFRRQGSA